MGGKEDEDLHNPFDEDGPPAAVPTPKWDPFAKPKKVNEADFEEDDEDVSSHDV